MGAGMDRRLRTAVAICGAVAALVYVGSLGHAFSMDDHYNVITNKEIRTLGNIPGMFVRAWGADSGSYHTNINAAYWRPLSSATLAINYAISPEPIGFHVTNVLLHAVTTMLLVVVLWQLIGALMPAAAPVTRQVAALGAGLWFAVHPVHSEVVNLVTYRTEMLATLFALGMLSVHLRSGDSWVRSLLWLPLLYAAGLTSKETAVTAPGWLFVLDLAIGRRPTIGRLVRTYGPLTLILGGYLAVRAALLTPSPITFFGTLDGSTIFFSVLKILATNFRLLVVPWPLIPFYDWTVLPPASSLADPDALAGALLVVLGIVLIGYAWRRQRAVSVGIAWIFLGLLPFLQIVPLPVGAAERFLYFPSVGAALLVAVGFGAVFERRRAAALIAGGLVLSLYAGLTIYRTTDWKNDRTILEAATRDFPHSYNAHHALGELHRKAGRVNDAEASFARAEELVPAMIPNVLQRAKNLADAGRRDDALNVLSDAIAARGPAPPLVELMSQLAAPR